MLACPPSISIEPDSRRVRAMVYTHCGFVWRQLRRFGFEEHDAEDGAQTVFVTAIRKLATTAPDAEKSLLYGIARRVASHHRRGVGRKRAVETDGVDQTLLTGVPDSSSFAKSGEAWMDRRAARIQLETMLARLPDEQREAFTLFALEELSLDEVSEIVGAPRGTVASRVRLARGRIERDLARLRAQRGGTPATNVYFWGSSPCQRWDRISLHPFRTRNAVSTTECYFSLRMGELTR